MKTKTHSPELVHKMNEIPSPNPADRQTLALVGWLALCFAASGTAVFVSTGGWYAGLYKPVWNPSAWVFGPTWTLLYVMMAVAAWLVWREGGWKARGRALGWFLLQWLLNALWTPLFFGMHRAGLAFAEIIALWLVLAATLRSFWWVRKAAGVLLVPYLAWVSFAAALNFTIRRMNP
jgi:benzodiazapine receptor